MNENETLALIGYYANLLQLANIPGARPLQSDLREWAKRIGELVEKLPSKEYA